MRLIDADDIIAIIEEKQKALCPAGRFGRQYVYGDDRVKFDAWDEILDAIDNIPTIDASSARHGEWIRVGLWYECSECKHESLSKVENFEPLHFKSNYCPHCGAIMDGKVNKNAAD